jgi:hypothetical protein
MLVALVAGLTAPERLLSETVSKLQVAFKRPAAAG